MFDWLRKLFHKPEYLEFPEGQGFDKSDVGGNGRLNREKVEELLKPIVTEKDMMAVRLSQKIREIENAEQIERVRQLNLKRQQDMLGYGLNSRNFKPRPAYEKRLWKLDKKPSLDED